MADKTKKPDPGLLHDLTHPAESAPTPPEADKPATLPPDKPAGARKLLDPELDTINKVAKLLAKLPDDGTRERVVCYLTDRYSPRYVPAPGGGA